MVYNQTGGTWSGCMDLGVANLTVINLCGVLRESNVNVKV